MYPFLVFVAFSFSLSQTEAGNGSGLSLDLIHRDSPSSPFHDPLKTLHERRKLAFQRSNDRVHGFASTGVLSGKGEYLMKISYGTPPVETATILDTGSDLSWIQCLPCEDCFPGKFPPFNPTNSSTYEPVSCETKVCQVDPRSWRSSCDPDSGNCLYKVVYGDSSYTIGNLATETMTLNNGSGNKTASSLFPKFLFGCGHVNVGAYPDVGSGIVGFGNGETSLVSQLSSEIQGKFSYCLGAQEDLKPGKLVLGHNDAISGDGVVSTPLTLDKHYTLTLEGISVGNKSLKYANLQNTSSLPENLIIDSGTTVTYLPMWIYDSLESAMKQEIQGDEVPDPLGFFGLCYDSLQSDQIPKLTLHFKGADLVLNPDNTFVGTSDAATCLAFKPAVDYNLFGSVQQTNFWVEYDLENKAVSFKPANCTLE